ncbi:MAG: acyl-CoA dehydrogenase [Pseudomonadales bacterium]|nr:acyl-CoA dehydrogenase [Pseudomonadales bacterium]
MAALTEEQSIIRDQAKNWVSSEAPVQSFREMRDSGNADCYEAPTWAAMVEMGWTGILIPESYGGSDLGYLTFGLILEELGRHLTASPLVSSALVGASAIMLGGSENQKQALLPKIVDGSEIFTLAVDERPNHAPAQIVTRAEAVDGGFQITGQKTFVPEGMAATQMIVAARTGGEAGQEDGISLFLIDCSSQGISRERMVMVDSRGYANVSLSSVKVSADQVLGSIDQGYPILAETLDRARAGLAAEMLGTSAQAFDMTLEYLKTREQFGRVIGSFQALGHRAAMLFSAMELARSCVEGALQAIDAQAEDRAQLVALSKCRVGDFLHEMSNQLIQIHGGIGMTDEFDAGFYLKRARVLEAMFGNQAYHRDRYAQLAGF